jgi:hypothetical protein
MGALIALLTCLVCVTAMIPVHEAGHYLAGWAAGLPRSDMRIRLLTFPQFVALRHDDGWVSPREIDLYFGKMSRHLTTPGRIFAYTAGGFLMETAVVVLLGLATLQLGYPRLTVIVVGMSLVMNTVYVVVMDLPWAFKFGHPCGDMSGLWWTAKVPTVLLAAGMLGVRAGLLWLAIA